MLGLFKTKSIESLLTEAGKEEQGLRRVLGPFNLTALGVGGIIGAGIFVLTGQSPHPKFRLIRFLVKPDGYDMRSLGYHGKN